MTAADLVGTTAYVLGLAALAGGVTTALGVGFRWYAGERVPGRFAVVAGLGVVALWLNAVVSLELFVAGNPEVTDLDAALVNVATFLAAGVTSVAGARVGDRLATDVVALAGARELDSEMSPLVRAVGAVIPVTLPEDVADLDGYDPVAPETKDHLAGTTLVFPRGLTVADLRGRLVRRLKDDYDVGAVDVELDGDGLVTYLALGRRQAGLGHTLPPGTTALAVRADPAHAASAGDTVQVWTAGDDPGLVATAELRAAVDDVVTLVTDTVDAAAVDPDGAYRLVTLPATPRVDREFARLLRTADETMGVVAVPEGSDLVGIPVGALDLTCIAVRPDDGPIEPIPSQSRVLAAGDTVYVVARPDAIRRLADAGVTTSL